ncbi:hypothetical protein [Streptomyces sp. NPDC101234]|uniref:hypothetical protein n=1 Tax=Streptomyces sp. NPDC101234 TaxID=3366138 RepID=UPI003822F2B9
MVTATAEHIAQQRLRAGFLASVAGQSRLPQVPADVSECIGQATVVGGLQRGQCRVKSCRQQPLAIGQAAGGAVRSVKRPALVDGQVLQRPHRSTGVAIQLLLAAGQHGLPPQVLRLLAITACREGVCGSGGHQRAGSTEPPGRRSTDELLPCPLELLARAFKGHGGVGVSAAQPRPDHRITVVGGRRERPKPRQQPVGVRVQRRQDGPCGNPVIQAVDDGLLDHQTAQQGGMLVASSSQGLERRHRGSQLASVLGPAVDRGQDCCRGGCRIPQLARSPFQLHADERGCRVVGSGDRRQCQLDQDGKRTRQITARQQGPRLATIHRR